MNDDRFINACKKEDIEIVDGMVQEGYPLYIYLKPVFRIIFEHELTKLFEYIVTYIKNHPLNNIDISVRRSSIDTASMLQFRDSDTFYHSYWSLIEGYKLFLTIKDNNLKELEKILKFNIMVYMDPLLIKKLITANISDDVLKLLHRINAQTYSWRVEENKYSILFSYLSRELAGYTNVIATFDNFSKEIFLDKLYSLEYSNLLLVIIKDGNYELIEFVKSRYNIVTSVVHYISACHVGDYKIALSIMNDIVFRVTKKYKIDDESIKSPKIINCIRSIFKKASLITAYRESVVSGNKQLIDFNARIVKKYCTEINHNPGRLISHLIPQTKIETIKRILKMITNLHEKTINVNYKINCCHLYVCFYYLCSCGMKEYIANRDPATANIVKYFDDLNPSIQEKVLGSEILNKNVLSLVYHYAKY